MNDCKTCYNETNSGEVYCFDCLNKQKEDRAKTGAHWLHVEYPTLYDVNGHSIDKREKPLSKYIDFLSK
jgi:hypothetical protein